MRYLNNTTGYSSGLPSPQTGYQVLADLTAATHGLDQLLGQVWGRLELTPESTLYDDRGRPVGTPSPRRWPRSTLPGNRRGRWPGTWIGPPLRVLPTVGEGAGRLNGLHADPHNPRPILLDAGLVTQRREGREVRYTIQPGRLHAAARTMIAAANRWDARLNAIKRIAEKLHQADTTAEEHKSDAAELHGGGRGGQEPP